MDNCSTLSSNSWLADPEPQRSIVPKKKKKVIKIIYCYKINTSQVNEVTNKKRKKEIRWD